MQLFGGGSTGKERGEQQLGRWEGISETAILGSVTMSQAKGQKGSL